MSHSIRERRRPFGSSTAEILFAAACVHPTTADVDRANVALAACSVVEFSALIHAAHAHGVLPLLHRHLSTRTFDSALVPAYVLDQMRRDATASERRSFDLARELVVLLRAFENDGIRVVPLKGPMLAQRLYGNAALRSIKDLDVLVDEADVGRATVTLTQLGYERRGSWGSNALQAKHYAASHHIRFRSTAKQWSIELHFLVKPPFRGRRHSLASIEDGLHRSSFLGEPVLEMRSEDLLVYLSAHGNHHVWERIEWIGCVAELLRSGTVADWSRVRELSQRLHAERAVAAALLVTSEVFGVAIPTAEFQIDGSARAAAAAVVDRLTQSPSVSPTPTMTLIHLLRTDVGALTRVARVWSTLFAPTVADLAAVPLPRVLWPLYWIVRPTRLLARRLQD